MFPYIETECGFQVLVGHKSYSVERSHENFEALLTAADENDKEKFLDLFSKEKIVSNNFAGTKVVVKDGVVFYENEAVHNTVTDKIVSFSERGLDPQPVINFLSNLMDNPSSRAVQELYNFLAHRKLPITEDGCFIAYKSVRKNFLDKYSGTFDNSVGQTVEVRRNQVDDNTDKHCSHGLHVGALEYAGPGGWYNSGNDKIVIVKVNPADAVSVPSDDKFTKLRVCKYEVIGEYEQELDDDYYEDKCRDCDNCTCSNDSDENDLINAAYDNDIKSKNEESDDENIDMGDDEDDDDDCCDW